MTFATTSSFFSSVGCAVPLLPLVRAANLSVAVAPRHSAKSMVEDCHHKQLNSEILFPQTTLKGTHVLPPQLLFNHRIRYIPA